MTAISADQSYDRIYAEKSCEYDVIYQNLNKYFTYNERIKFC